MNASSTAAKYCGYDNVTQGSIKKHLTVYNRNLRPLIHNIHESQLIILQLQLMSMPILEFFKSFLIIISCIGILQIFLHRSRHFDSLSNQI